MSAEQTLSVVLYWHMHQPLYKDVHSGNYHLPWTYLHVIKDYVDMVAHLEDNPDARAVVNFTPTLLEQIDDYANQINNYLNRSTVLKDQVLADLVENVLPASTEKRMEIIHNCLRANEDRMINSYPQYKLLVEQARLLDEQPDAIIYLHDQFLADLLVWFHLAWMGETVQRSDLRVRKLISKEKGFTIEDRHELLNVIGDLCSGVIERYRILAERKQIELSFTPYAHPIMPLLYDFNSTREAMSDAILPACQNYPGGAERVDWHIEKGLEVFKHYFGFTPTGCWPSEGSICETSLHALSRHGIKWIASGESVLRNSLAHHEHIAQNCIHEAYRLHDTQSQCFFRDDGLSDMIGFTYADWHADDAVANLVHHLENIKQACADKQQTIVSIILDGENAWEYYPQNAFYFLSTLYRELSEHKGINLTTYQDYLASHDKATELSKLVAGSWVYGTFSTWIGSEDKNTGWDMLCEAKNCVDRALSVKKFSEAEIDRINTQLAICEGSDWFWWFGDYNAAESVSDFEYLYRLQLSHLYKLIGELPPASLSESFTHGSVMPDSNPEMGGTMRRGQEH